MTQLVFAASHRPASLNRKLAWAVAEELKAHLSVDFEEYGNLDLPLYDDAGVERDGIPPVVETLAERVRGLSGLVIAAPEYNWSIPGTLKNWIDWLSRVRPVPLAGKTALLLSASPSMVGGVRGLMHLRAPLEALGVFVHPKMFTVGKAHEVFDEAGTLTEPLLARQAKEIAEGYADYVRRLAV